MSQSGVLSHLEARAALTTALESWKAGTKPDANGKTTSPITLVDSQWGAGQALEDYRLEGDGIDETALPGPAFAVTLRVKGAKADTKTRYIIFGREPTWVYREEDWARLLNMDNNPRPPSARGRL